MKKNATLKEVAKEAGVSPITVSRVFSSPGIVSNETRNKVEAVAKNLHYTPNALARALATNTTKTIAILVPDIANIYHPMIIQRLVSGLEQYEYQSIMSITDGSADKEENALALAVENRVAGIIMLGTRIDYSEKDAESIDALSANIPIVMLGYPYGRKAYSAHADERGGIYKAMEYLLRLGHKKIGFINGNGNAATYFYKRAGYEKACSDYGLDLQNGYYVSEAPYFSGGITGANRLLDLPSPPTAILTAGDQIAMGVYYAVKARELRIPHDLSVIGFSGTNFSSVLYPALTTVNQFPEKCADAAVQMLMDHICGNPMEPKNIVFETEMIERDSCKKVLW